MKRMYASLIAMLLMACAVSDALAQRTRSVSDPVKNQSKETMTTPPPAPQSVRAKYEGGVFGYNRKQDGTLNFDDENRRLVFRDKAQHEVLSLHYDAIAAAFADTQSRRPTAASVAGGVFPYGLPALLIKKKYRYLSVQYRDTDTQVSGVTSFKLENKELLASVLNTLASKAGLTQRGEIFVRRKDATSKSEQPTSPN